MSSKPKCKTFVVHQIGNFGSPTTIIGRYIVGARNEKEAEELLRKKIGKHTKVRVYYEDKENKIPHGKVAKSMGVKDGKIIYDV